jgi:amidohydrolase
MDRTALKQRVAAAVDADRDLLLSVSHQIHEHPELCYEEHFAHDLLTSVLEQRGIDTERGAYGMATAFDAVVGTEGAQLAVLCEYDALPEIGHACGHNVIAAAGLGAGLAAATIAAEVGGRLRILGTPAEEGGGGKVRMIERGAFEGIDAAMMVHPAGYDLQSMNTVAIHPLSIEYFGLAAHAAAAPELGRNALDAAVLGYVNVAALRQHIGPQERVHGVFTHGGDKPNIVPAYASQEWYVRSNTTASLQPLKDRVLTCLEAGATAAGCTCSHQWGDVPYSDMIDNWPVLGAYIANATALGRVVQDPADVVFGVGSTDMGNVSYAVPSIHPMIKVSPSGVSIHTPAFTGHARSETGDQAVLDGAKAMAMTLVDLWTDPSMRAAAAAEHQRALAARLPS